MHLRIITLLILSSFFYQAHPMDRDLAAENMEIGWWSDFKHWLSNKRIPFTQTTVGEKGEQLGEVVEQMKYDNERITGGVPGLGYLRYNHPGKSLIACAVIIGGYLLYRKYKNKQLAKEKREQEEKDAEKTDTPTTPPLPKKELNEALVKMLAYVSAQMNQISHWIK